MVRGKERGGGGPECPGPFACGFASGVAAAVGARVFFSCASAFLRGLGLI